MCLPVATSDSSTFPLFSPEATVVPSGENAIETIELAYKRVERVLPVATSQSRIVLSYEPEATTLPSGENNTLKTQCVCPSSVA